MTYHIGMYVGVLVERTDVYAVVVSSPIKTPGLKEGIMRCCFSFQAPSSCVRLTISTCTRGILTTLMEHNGAADQRLDL